jgi:hypothetical protein
LLAIKKGRVEDIWYHESWQAWMGFLCILMVCGMSSCFFDLMRVFTITRFLLIMGTSAGVLSVRVNFLVLARGNHNASALVT